LKTINQIQVLKSFFKKQKISGKTKRLIPQKELILINEKY